MKKIFCLILIAVSINGFGQGFPGQQSMANANTRLIVNGGLEAVRGLINGVFTDTTAANSDKIDFYNGAQIYTRSDRNFWLRDSVLNMWIRMAKYSELGAYTGSNGLSLVGNDFQLGGTFGSPSSLVNSRYISTGAFTLNITTSSGGVTPLATQSASGIAFAAVGTGAGSGMYSESNSGFGLEAFSFTGSAGAFYINPSSTNTVASAIKIYRNTSALAADGIGGSIDFLNESDDFFSYTSNQIISKFTTVANATRISQLIFTGVNNAVTGDILTLNGNKSIKANGYGSGNFTGTPTYTLQVDASGNIIEGAASGGSESTTASNVGGGAEVFKQLTGADLEFRTLVAGDGIGVVENTNDITISSTVSIINNEPWYKYRVDMSGGAGQTLMYFSNTGAGSSIVSLAAPPYTGWPSTTQLQTGTTSSGIAYGHIGNSGLVAGINFNTTTRFNYAFDFAVEDLSDGSETYALQFGYADHTVEASISDGAWFWYTHGDSSGKLVCKTRKTSGSTTAVATSITLAADTRYLCEISVFNTHALFYVNKVLVADITTNIPDGTSQTTSIVNLIKKSAGSTTRKLYVREIAYGDMDQ